MPSYNTLVSEFLNKSDEMTLTFLSENFHNLANYMAMPLSLMSILYVVILGYLILFGKVQVSSQAFIKLALSIGGVNVFALSWLYFNDFFVALFLNVASDISSVGANSHYFDFTHLVNTGSGVNDALQTVLTESVEVGVNIMKHVRITNWLPILVGLNFVGGGTTVVALGLIEISMIKFFICLLLSTAPLFIPLYLFEETRQMYKSWLGLLAGFSFALVFSGLTIGMAMSWMHWVIAPLHQSDQFDLRAPIIVPLFVVEILAILVFIAVIPLAKSIGGAVGGGGSHTDGVLSAGQSLAKKAFGAANKAHSMYKGGTK